MMTTGKISQLTNGAPAQSTDQIAIARAGASYRLTVQDIVGAVVVIPSHDMVSGHAYSGGAALDVFGLTAASTIGKITPSAAPGAAAAILASTAAGGLTLVSLTAPTINTKWAFTSSGATELRQTGDDINGTTGFYAFTTGDPTGTGTAGGEGPAFLFGFNGGAAKYNYAGNMLGRVGFQGQANDLSYLGARLESYVETGGNIARADAVASLTISTKDAGSASPLERARFTGVGNFLFGGSANRASTVGTKIISIFDGTAPIGTLANGCSIYSTSGELYTMDAGGTATLQTPHDDDGLWVFHSKNTVTGQVVHIDMERMMKALNDRFGWDFVSEYVEAT